MNIEVNLFAASIALLPVLACAQISTDFRVTAPQVTAASAPALGFSRHKVTDFCTTTPRNEWLDAAEMKLLVLHRGYRIKTFKISKTNCYEVYGFDKDNRVVEAYFHPITTRLMLQNIAK